jgi:hypothetical protein
MRSNQIRKKSIHQRTLKRHQQKVAMKKPPHYHQSTGGGIGRIHLRRKYKLPKEKLEILDPQIWRWNNNSLKKKKNLKAEEQKQQLILHFLTRLSQKKTKFGIKNKYTFKNEFPLLLLSKKMSQNKSLKDGESLKGNEVEKFMDTFQSHYKTYKGVLPKNQYSTRLIQEQLPEIMKAIIDARKMDKPDTPDSLRDEFSRIALVGRSYMQNISNKNIKNFYTRVSNFNWKKKNQTVKKHLMNYIRQRYPSVIENLKPIESNRVKKEKKLGRGIAERAQAAKAAKAKAVEEAATSEAAEAAKATSTYNKNADVVSLASTKSASTSNRSNSMARIIRLNSKSNSSLRGESNTDSNNPKQEALEKVERKAAEEVEAERKAAEKEEAARVEAETARLEAETAKKILERKTELVKTENKFRTDIDEMINSVKSKLTDSPIQEAEIIRFLDKIQQLPKELDKDTKLATFVVEFEKAITELPDSFISFIRKVTPIKKNDGTVRNDSTTLAMRIVKYPLFYKEIVDDMIKGSKLGQEFLDTEKGKELIQKFKNTENEQLKGTYQVYEKLLKDKDVPKGKDILKFIADLKKITTSLDNSEKSLIKEFEKAFYNSFKSNNSNEGEISKSVKILEKLQKFPGIYNEKQKEYEKKKEREKFYSSLKKKEGKKLPEFSELENIGLNKLFTNKIIKESSKKIKKRFVKTLTELSKLAKNNPQVDLGQIISNMIPKNNNNSPLYNVLAGKKTRKNFIKDIDQAIKNLKTEFQKNPNAATEKLKSPRRETLANRANIARQLAKEARQKRSNRIGAIIEQTRKSEINNEPSKLSSPAANAIERRQAPGKRPQPVTGNGTFNNTKRARLAERAAKAKNAANKERLRRGIPKESSQPNAISLVRAEAEKAKQLSNKLLSQRVNEVINRYREEKDPQLKEVIKGIIQEKLLAKNSVTFKSLTNTLFSENAKKDPQFKEVLESVYINKLKPYFNSNSKVLGAIQAQKVMIESEFKKFISNMNRKNRLTRLKRPPGPPRRTAPLPLTNLGAIAKKAANIGRLRIAASQGRPVQLKNRRIVSESES